MSPMALLSTCLLLGFAATGLCADPICPDDVKEITDKYGSDDPCVDIMLTTINGPDSGAAIDCPREAYAVGCFNQQKDAWMGDLSGECTSKATKSICMKHYAAPTFYDWLDGGCAVKLADVLADYPNSDECKAALNATIYAADQTECRLVTDVQTCFKNEEKTWLDLVAECPTVFHASPCLGYFSDVTSFASFVDGAPKPNAAAASGKPLLAAAAAVVALAALLA